MKIKNAVSIENSVKKINHFSNSQIGKNFNHGNNLIILSKVIIGDNVKVGNNVIIYPNTIIKDNVEIQDNSIIGKLPWKSLKSSSKAIYPHVVIGKGTFVGSYCTIYAHTTIGKNCLIGDMSSIRENCMIEDKTIIGRMVGIECNTKIGKHVTIETACHITAQMTIEDNVFFGPEVTTVNDKSMKGKPPFKGPHIKRGVKIGGNATILPEIVIGENAIIGAGAVVTKNISPNVIAVGVPAIAVGNVS